MSCLANSSLSRRQILVLLLSWAFWATAFAEDGKDDKKSGDKKDDKSGKNSGKSGKPEDGDKKDDSKKPSPNSGNGSNSGKDPSRPSDDANRSRTIYDSVSVARNGTVVLSSGKLETSSPWANYLAPGMWVRAQGTWVQDLFKATNLEIADPSYFSYYRGPGSAIGNSASWVEAWYTANTPNAVSQRLLVQTTSPANEVLLLVRSEGGKLVAAPPGLPPVANPPQGWILARGEVQGDTIRWKSVESFNR